MFTFYEIVRPFLTENPYRNAGEVGGGRGGGEGRGGRRGGGGGGGGLRIAGRSVCSCQRWYVPLCCCITGDGC